MSNNPWQIVGKDSPPDKSRWVEIKYTNDDTGIVRGWYDPRIDYWFEEGHSYGVVPYEWRELPTPWEKKEEAEK